MVKRFIWIAMVLLVLSLATPALAADGNGKINGQLVNGSKQPGSVADQSITMKVLRNGSEQQTLTAKSDSEGRFTFSGLNTSGYSYQIIVTYQEAEYDGDQITFAPGETEKTIKVDVYNSTGSDENISVVMAHTIVYHGKGELMVKEYYQVANMSDTTYIGSKVLPADATKKETLRFPMPEGAKNLQTGNGLMSCCVYNTQGGFVDSMAVMPGAKEITFTYSVSYKSAEYLFSRKAEYPTVRYDFLYQGNATPGTGLTADEPLDIQGTTLSHMSATDIKKGVVLEARFTGLPKASASPIIWIGLTALVLAGGFGASIVLRQRQPQPVKVAATATTHSAARGAVAPAQRKQKLLLELAQLDDAFENGKISEEAYRQRRAEKKSQLLSLVQKTRKGDQK